LPLSVKVIPLGSVLLLRAGVGKPVAVPVKVVPAIPSANVVLLAMVMTDSISTVWVIADDVLALKLLSLLYTVVIKSEPNASEVVVQVAASGEPALSV
jgi:hypothetical protein